jgi:hypothetical protein
MRTREELEIEARRLEQRTRDVSINPEALIAATGAGAKPLFTFPETSVALTDGSESGRTLRHRTIRHISLVEARAGFEYRLFEEVFVTDLTGAPVQHSEPIEISAGGGALGILSLGFQRMDEDRLWERIEPVIGRIEADGFTESERAETVADIERSTTELNFSIAGRIRMRCDAIDLLEGRLEIGDFVARCVARQECYAATQREVLSYQNTESIKV